MLDIDNSLMIGKGANRICYQHPADSGKCIKIPISDSHKVQTLECKYLQKLKSAGIPWRHMSQYYGEIETSRGKGYVYELIRDYDNKISKKLTDYLGIVPEEYIEFEAILHSLAELKIFLLDYKIIVRNLRPYNILLKRPSHQDCIAMLIDNFGHHNSLPHLSDHIAYLAHKAVEKKWKNLETRVNKLH